MTNSAVDVATTAASTATHPTTTSAWTAASLYPQPSTLPQITSNAALYKPSSSLSRPEQHARGFYTALAHIPKQTEDEQLKTRYLEFYDFLNNARSVFFATAIWEHISFAKDWIKYQFNYNNQLLPIETQRLKPSYVIRTIYSAHLGRCLKFFPAVVAMFEGPYLLTGDQRWSPNQYMATGAILGFYYGLLTKRRPLFMLTATIIPSLIGGIYGQLEDLRGRPLNMNSGYLGQRRTSDEAANRAIEANWVFKNFV